jgi:hypothetical protein
MASRSPKCGCQAASFLGVQFQSLCSVEHPAPELINTPRLTNKGTVGRLMTESTESSLLGLFPLGVDKLGIFAPIQTYVIDSFPQYAASALTGLSLLRYLFGVLSPLAGRGTYSSLGLGWGIPLFGFVAIAKISFPIVIYKYGSTVREVIFHYNVSLLPVINMMTSNYLNIDSNYTDKEHKGKM